MKTIQKKILTWTALTAASLSFSSAFAAPAVPNTIPMVKYSENEVTQPRVPNQAELTALNAIMKYHTGSSCKQNGMAMLVGFNQLKASPEQLSDHASKTLMSLTAMGGEYSSKRFLVEKNYVLFVAEKPSKNKSSSILAYIYIPKAPKQNEYTLAMCQLKEAIMLPQGSKELKN